MSAWPDYDGKVINVEFRVSDDPKAAEWLFNKSDMHKPIEQRWSSAEIVDVKK